jgi:methyltransferase (TIGR00027 family)
VSASASGSPISSISDTARWIAALRAEESARPDALFHDPLAARLAGERGVAIARAMPGGATTSWAIALRTRAIDQAILAAVGEGFDTVLSLAAGLDARPYRLALPAALRWIEVDLPALVAAKDEALRAETPRCRLERMPCDLADPDARRALLARVGAEAGRMLVLTEGLLMYLDEASVAGLATDLAACRPVERWVADLIASPMVRFYQWRWEAQLAPADARFRFAPDQGIRFFAPYGWHERRFHSMMEDAQAVGRAFWPADGTRLLSGLVPPLYDWLARLGGVMELERAGA